MNENNENSENRNSPQENQENISPNKILKKIKSKKLKFRNKNETKKKKKKKKGIHIGIGSIILILFCAFLLVVATFLQINVTHVCLPLKLFTGEVVKIEDYLFSIKYIPQIPIVLFITGLLGRRLGFVSVLIYIIAGLFIIPVFALGGGWRYIFEYSFGYILAFLPAGFILGTILKKDYTYKNIAKAVFFAILTIHLVGVCYMTALAVVKHAGLNFVLSWIAAQSGVKMFYDFVFSFFMVLLTKYARIILWFYL